MKVTRIEIKDFNQFKDIDIDLTYPKGHAKEGQPLDKVCFIGQSGTGKTTLLKVIGNSCFYIYSDIFFKSSIAKISIDRIHDNYFQKFFMNSLGEGGMSYYFQYLDDKSELYFKEKKELGFDLGRLINFPANLRYESKKRSDLIFIFSKNIVDFEIDNISELWDEILDNVIKYRETIVSLKNQISDIATSGDTGFYKDKLSKAISSYNKWIENNPNPLEDISNNCIDVLLAPFKLKVKRDFEFTKKEDLDFIKIEDFNGNEVPFDLWSTGTRQLLYSTLPIYLLKPENTIILFDEPERSLYPDMQRMIIDFYSSLTKDSQFFYATHSPIIASSFEPWEIVELKIGENGHVYQDIYYEGERHVDNYKWNPKYMRWDDILQRIFDLSTDGSLEREKKLNELAMLNVKYRKLKEKNTKNTTEMDAILLEINQLKNILSKYD